MNLICLLIGHAFHSRVTAGPQGNVYIGEICPRCATPMPDHLTPPAKTLGHAFAKVTMEHRPEFYVNILHMEQSIGDGIEIKLVGRVI